MPVTDKQVHVVVPPEMKEMFRFQRYKYKVPITEQIRLCILHCYFEFQVDDQEFDVEALVDSVDAELEGLEGGEN